MTPTQLSSSNSPWRCHPQQPFCPCPTWHREAGVADEDVDGPRHALGFSKHLFQLRRWACGDTRWSSSGAAAQDGLHQDCQAQVSGEPAAAAQPTLCGSAVSADSACSRCPVRSVPPAAASSRICCSAASRSAWLRATTVTLQPRCAQRRASARPSPLEPPVMRTWVPPPRRRALQRRHSTISAAGASTASSVM